MYFNKKPIWLFFDNLFLVLSIISEFLLLTLEDNISETYLLLFVSLKLYVSGNSVFSKTLGNPNFSRNLINLCKILFIFIFFDL